MSDTNPIENSEQGLGITSWVIALCLMGKKHLQRFHIKSVEQYIQKVILTNLSNLLPRWDDCHAINIRGEPQIWD